MANYIGADRGFQYLFDAVDDVKNDIAEQYDSTATYAVGDYVLYENILYKCITAVSTAESFDNTKWTQVVLTDQIAAGGVSDVQIDSVSVVSGGIANIPSMTGATTASAGTKGLIPAPTTADESKFFKGDGTWSVPPSGSTVSISPVTTAGTKIADFSIDGVNGELYAPSGSGGVMDVQVDGVSVVSGGVATIDTMIGATTAAAGAKGLVPAPLAGDEDKYLKGDGTWAAVQAGAGALSGLSDVDLTTPTDGQALVYDETNDVWVNGNVSGGGGGTEAGSGVFIDTTNIIQEFVSVKNTTATYTASQDCAIVYSLSRASGNSNYVKVDSVTVMEGYDSNGVGVETGLLYVKTGQVVDFKSTYNSNTDGYTVYGVTTHILQTALIYSEEEREVGVWTDGKPLYQRTFDLGSDTPISYNTLTNTTIDASDMQTLVNVRGLNSSGVTNYSLMANISNNVIRLQTDRNGGEAYVRYLTLQYTKTTDTAGSGTWTTTGEYAHHYSTSEKVVGTWIDGKPLYEKCIDGGTLPNNTSKSIAHGISNLGDVIECKGWARNGSDRHVIPIVNSANANYQVGFYINDTNIIVADNYNYSGYTTSYFIIRYTKTTDV